MLGYIFNDYTDKVESDIKYLVNSINPDKSGKTATVFLEII